MANEFTIAGAFNLGGSIHDIQPYGDGLINDTYLVTVGDGAAHKVILQRINDRVFPEPRRIMENLRILLDHVHRRQSQKGGDDRHLRLPDLYPTRNGGDFVVDKSGAVWRAMYFIDNARAYARIAHAAQAEEVGAVLGCFHALVSDLDPGKLRDSLRGFHDTSRYLERFSEVSARYGKQALSEALQQCYVFIDEHRKLVDTLEQAKREGGLSPRTVHGDPKLDNFLFDLSTGKVVSLIDLDTVQPGLLFYDIGDCLRSCCNPAGENPDDPKAACFDLELFHAFLHGYFKEAGGVVSGTASSLLYDAIRLIPFELGVRFLTDYLDGNRYFKINAPEQNLLRALTQFKLTADIERQEKEIRRQIVDFAGP